MTFPYGYVCGLEDRFGFQCIGMMTRGGNPLSGLILGAHKAGLSVNPWICASHLCTYPGVSWALIKGALLCLYLLTFWFSKWFWSNVQESAFPRS